MHVEDIKIARFRHLEDAHIGSLHTPGERSDLVVLAGPNGGGKSSIVELVAFALSNTWGWSWAVRRTFPKSSFEVRIGLNDADLQQIEEMVKNDPELDRNGVFPELKQRRSYSRGFDFTEGDYGAETELHDRMHRLASTALANYRRAMFLRSDRYYEPQGYKRERIFDSAQKLEAGYWRNVTFTLTAKQYADQVEFLIEQMYNFPRRLGLYQLARDEGTDVGDAPTDPIEPYDEFLNRLFPHYSIVRSNVDNINPPSQLQVKLPNGVEVPLTDLSSGEQEVFFVLSFFLRHDIRSSMVFVDEPELHLHPELVRRMVRIMLGIRPGNQVWLATHNAELIDEAGVDKTYFVDRSDPTGPGRVILAADDETFVSKLRTMFGYAGYVGLARRLVFLEGNASSTDRRVFIELFPDASDQISFVPLNSSDYALRVHRAVLSVLGEGLGHCEFFLIRDRDYLPQSVVEKYEEDTSGRLHVLQRHEIENYLLDTTTIREVLLDFTNQDVAPGDVESSLREVAISLSGEVLRDMVGARLNMLFQAHDCSIGGFEANSTWLSNTLVWNEEVVNAANTRFKDLVHSAREAVLDCATEERVDSLLQEAQAEIVSALQGDGWRRLFPGKEMIERLGVRYGFKKGPVFVNLLIRRLAEHPERIDPELKGIIERIVADPQAAPAQT